MTDEAARLQDDLHVSLLLESEGNSQNSCSVKTGGSCLPSVFLFTRDARALNRKPSLCRLLPTCTETCLYMHIHENIHICKGAHIFLHVQSNAYGCLHVYVEVHVYLYA